jgi:hypothetical protein
MVSYTFLKFDESTKLKNCNVPIVPWVGPRILMLKTIQIYSNTHPSNLPHFGMGKVLVK